MIITTLTTNLITMIHQQTEHWHLPQNFKVLYKLDQFKVIGINEERNEI